MLTKALAKIDKFFPIFVVVAAILGAVIVFTFKTVLLSVSISNEIEQDIPDAEIRIDKVKLDRAYDAVQNKVIVPLEIR